MSQLYMQDPEDGIGVLLRGEQAGKEKNPSFLHCPYIGF